MRIVGSAGEIGGRDLSRIVFSDGAGRSGLAGFIKALLDHRSEGGYCLGIEFNRGKSESVFINFEHVIQVLAPQGNGRFCNKGNVLSWEKIWALGYDKAAETIFRKVG